MFLELKVVTIFFGPFVFLLLHTIIFESGFSGVVLL